MMQRFRLWCAQWHVLVLAAAVIFLILIPYVGDNDFWFHLRTGEVIWEEHIFPRTDIFSYTAFGMPWTNHEWLAQLTFYGLYLSMGFPGVALAVAFVGSAMAIAMLWEYRRSFWLSYALVLVSFTVLRPFFVPRPQIFAYAFLLGLILALGRYYQTRSKKMAWLLPVILFFWGNTHASVVIGAGVLGIVMAMELAQQFFKALPSRSLADSEPRTLIVASAAAIGASFINPFFYQTYLYALQPLRYAQAYHSLIETKPIFQNLNFGPVLALFVIHLVLGALCTWLFMRRQTPARPYEKVLFVVFFLAPFASIKYVPFSWMAMVPIVLRYLPEPAVLKKYVPAVVAASVCAATLFLQPWILIAADPHREWPKDLVAFMDDRDLQGNVYNSYTWGGYMMWESKRRPVFIYGGYAGFYGLNYFDSLDFAEGKRTDELIEKYNFSITLVRPWEPLAYTLSLKEDWQLVYWDNFGMIFVREDGKNETVLKERGMTIKYINDAVDAMVRKYPSAELPQLERNLKRVIEQHPDTLLARYRLGFLYKAAERCDMAIEHFKAIIAIDGRLGGAHGRLAECYAALNIPELARQEQDLSRQYAKNQRWWYGRP